MNRNARNIVEIIATFVIVYQLPFRLAENRNLDITNMSFTYYLLYYLIPWTHCIGKSEIIHADKPSVTRTNFYTSRRAFPRSLRENIGWRESPIRGISHSWAADERAFVFTRRSIVSARQLSFWEEQFYSRLITFSRFFFAGIVRGIRLDRKPRADKPRNIFAYLI